jgi:hypothetical protein
MQLYTRHFCLRPSWRMCIQSEYGQCSRKKPTTPWLFTCATGRAHTETHTHMGHSRQQILAPPNDASAMCKTSCDHLSGTGVVPVRHVLRDLQNSKFCGIHAGLGEKHHYLEDPSVFSACVELELPAVVSEAHRTGLAHSRAGMWQSQHVLVYTLW